MNVGRGLVVVLNVVIVVEGANVKVGTTVGKPVTGRKVVVGDKVGEVVTVTVGIWVGVLVSSHVDGGKLLNKQIASAIKFSYPLNRV